MLRLAFLRHGQTPCSVRGCYCGGGCDVGLNANGQRMAEAIASTLVRVPWTAVASSPQQRALQTVAPLARALAKTADIYEDLRELGYGDWDGQTPDELDRDPGYRAWLDDPAAHAPPGGETAIAVATRATRAVQEMGRRHADGHILVVSHKTTIRVLLCALLGLDPKLYRVRLAQPLGGLSSVTITDRGPRLDALADLSHLPAELRGLAGS